MSFWTATIDHGSQPCLTRRTANLGGSSHFEIHVVCESSMMTCFNNSRSEAYLNAISRLGFERPRHQISSSYTDGMLGEAVTGDAGAAVIVGDLVELSGCFDREVYDRVSSIDESHLVEPPQCWIAGIRRMKPDSFRAYEREAFKPLSPDEIGVAADLEPSILAIDGIPVEISPIEDDDVEALLRKTWSADLVANTRTIDQAHPGTLGFIARLRGRIIGGIGCYAVYRTGVEIQIDTHADFRRRGVATELAKRMLLECRSRSLECHWDAMNAQSAALARKVGFVSDRTYRCYEMRARRLR